MPRGNRFELFLLWFGQRDESSASVSFLKLISKGLALLNRVYRFRWALAEIGCFVLRYRNCSLFELSWLFFRNINGQAILILEDGQRSGLVYLL